MTEWADDVVATGYEGIVLPLIAFSFSLQVRQTGVRYTISIQKLVLGVAIIIAL